MDCQKLPLPSPSSASQELSRLINGKLVPFFSFPHHCYSLLHLLETWWIHSSKRVRNDGTAKAGRKRMKTGEHKRGSLYIEK